MSNYQKSATVLLQVSEFNEADWAINPLFFIHLDDADMVEMNECLNMCAHEAGRPAAKKLIAKLKPALRHFVELYDEEEAS